MFDFLRYLPRRPKLPERLFFALFPDIETSIRAAQLRERFLGDNRLTGTLIGTERLHVSLHHLGDYKRLKARIIYAARLAGAAISLPPFEVTFRRIATFDTRPPVNGRHRRPLVLLGESAVLTMLHGRLGAAMARYGFRAAEHFVPHMTLAYGPRRVPEQSIEPIRFVADGFALVHSRLWLSQYDLIDRWSLNA